MISSIKKDKLHVLEVATFWGAAQAYFLRGYKEKLSVNSFPCECFSEEETQAYVDYYGSSILALDDYGAGFNDFEKVKIIEPHIIKIDRALLSGIDTKIEKQKNCKDIIEKMHELNVQVVAEGVETKEEFEYLKGIGADYFQGYYLARTS